MGNFSADDLSLLGMSTPKIASILLLRFQSFKHSDQKANASLRIFFFKRVC